MGSWWRGGRLEAGGGGWPGSCQGARYDEISLGKVALVTGAASGIGRGIAYRYAAEGAKVVVADVDEAGGAETATQIRARDGRALFLRADTSKPADCEALVKAAIKEFGALHVAANNAGIAGP